MERLARHSEKALTLLRIVAGALFACHGAQKLFGVFGGFGGHPGATAPMGSLLWVGGIIELGCGLLIALGLLTRPAAFLASGMMAVAYFMAHAPKAFWPIQNGGELAAIYCFLFLCLFLGGPGRYSLDDLLRSRRPAAVAPGDATVP